MQIKRAGYIAIKIFLLVVLCALAGWLLLTVAYCIPVTRMEGHVKNSAYMFETETAVGGYKELTGDRASSFDYLSDALMLMTSAYRSERPVWQAALYAELEGVEEKVAQESIVLLARDDAGELERIVTPYARYWHGYQVIVKPLLWLFGYGKIRYTLMYLHLGLFLWLQVKLFQINKKMCLPLFFAWMFLHPPVIMLSLMYSWMSLTAVAAMLSMLYLYEKHRGEEEPDMERWCLFFTLIGCVATYLDLLTFPLITLGLPLILWLSLYASGRFKTDAPRMIGLSVCWGAGYGFMWALKWVIASLFTEDNIIRDALDQMKVRSGIAEYSYADILKNNLSAPGTGLFVLLALVVAAGVVWRLISHKKIRLLYPVLACYPFLWYAAIQNHSYHHSHFTYRDLSVTVFAVLAMLTDVYQNKKTGEDNGTQ